jgi:hypothetical protein
MSSMKHTAVRLAMARLPYSPERSSRINPNWTGPNTTDLGKLMQAHPNFASLGAIGPDLFFFLPDFRDQHGIRVSSVLVEVLKFLEDAYSAVDPYISKWEHYLGPISEDTAEEMSRLTGGLSETAGDISGELSGILITLLEDFVTQQRDWWKFFSLGLNTGIDDQAYFWSDMLHYRNTGQFARAIWKNAEAADSDQARAYALGYNTHLATDVTGHAFVNSISGGPFRLHWQRHHLVENHMDAFWYLKDPLAPRSGDNYPQITESALYYDIAFAEDTGDVVNRPSYPTGGTLRENWERKRLLDVDSAMPDPLPDILLKSMMDVFYPNGPHPKILDGDGRPSADLIKQAYDLLFRYLKLATVDGFSHEPPEPPDVFPNLDFPTMSDPAGDDPPGDGGGGGDDGGSFWDDLLDFILSAIAVIAYAAEVAAWLLTLPVAIVLDLATYPLRYLLYWALELPLFHMLKSFRAVLVMTGYILPMDDEIAQPLIEIGSTDSGIFAAILQANSDVFGGWLPPAGDKVGEQTFRDPNYPHSIPRDDSNDTIEYRAPWNYPTSVTELHERILKEEQLPVEFEISSPQAFLDSLMTTSGPHPAGATPTVLFGGTGSNTEIRDRLEKAATPGDADFVGSFVQPASHLGDAVAFSEYFIWLESRNPIQEHGVKVPLVEWNLDSDCGYGYHCWDWNRNPDKGAAQKDPEGNPFLQPCTWPSQADENDSGDAPAAPATWNASIRLKLHWVGQDLQDPGCDPPPSPTPRRRRSAFPKKRRKHEG